MKNLTLFLIMNSLITLPAFAAESWNGRIIRASDQTQISQAQLVTELSAANHIVMGEKHYTPAVQNAQAGIISGVVQLTGQQNNFTTAWEFLHASQQKMVQALFARFVAGEITAKDFLDYTQGPSEQNVTYAPVLEVTKTLGGNILATNLTRQEKSPVVKNGIGAVDPALLPPDFEMGSEGYHQRFVDIMGQAGHATPAQIENYYAAQCLTDDVIAWHVVTDSTHSLKFLVVGSFHTDYFDGTVARIKIRAPGLKTASVTIVDASDYEEKDLEMVARDQKYGDLADYVYFVNEPSTAEYRILNTQTKKVKQFLEQLF